MKKCIREIAASYLRTGLYNINLTNWSLTKSTFNFKEKTFKSSFFISNGFKIIFKKKLKWNIEFWNTILISFNGYKTV